MSRSGYIDDYDDNWALIKWRGQVASAIRGKRGQKLLAGLLAALDAMPEKSLIAGELETKDGEVCPLGALGKALGIDIQKLDPEDPDAVAAAFDIAPQLAQEITYMNDEHFNRATPEDRWALMRAWVASHIVKPAVLACLLSCVSLYATSTSVSISGSCAPFQTAASLQGDPVGVQDPQRTCPEGMTDYATESASAGAWNHSFYVQGSGITGDGYTNVEADASYTETDLVTGGQGAGILSLLFDASLVPALGPSSAVTEQLAASVGTGGFEVTCYNTWHEGCPYVENQYQVTLEIPFTYGDPFTYTVSFDTSGGAGGGSFIYSGGASLVSASTGNLQDVIVDPPNPSEAPEASLWPVMLMIAAGWLLISGHRRFMK